MVILGLGSNIGDRLANLRKALSEIKSIIDAEVIRVSPVYISDALMPENAPADWDMPYLNCAVSISTSLDPFELLKILKTIEAKIGRKPEVRHWGPRIIDIDILAWEEKIIQSEVLTLPHDNLQERPFALWPLADIAPLWVYKNKTAAEMVEPWGSRFSGEAPFHTRQINQRIDTPQLMGIVNLTPDSFSDGNHYLETNKAIEHAIHLVNTGAEIIDIGAESTAPKANAISHKLEWERLKPVLDALQTSTFLLPPKISIDTYHPETAEKVLNYNIDIINDVTGLDDARMRAIIKSANIDCVIMHHKQIPERRDDHLPRHLDPTPAVLEWFQRRLQILQDEGFNLDKLIIDPGIGFGKLSEQSLLLLKNISAFKSLQTRVLVGHSRKTFLSLLSGLSFTERDIETMVMSLYLAREQVDILRLHNIELCARGLRVQANF